MGWGRWLLDDGDQDNDLAEHLAEIEILAARLNKTAMGQASVTDELRRLTMENHELKLYVSAAFHLLLAKGIVGRDELEGIVAAIDREDGTEDGRRQGPVMSQA
jgi:hypothetical protein